MNAELKIEREKTKQIALQELTSLLKAPMYQALTAWILVELLQTKYNFGSVTGTVLEGATMIRLFDMEKVTGDITAITKSLAPLALMVK